MNAGLKVGRHTYGQEQISGHPSTNGDVRIGNDVWVGSNVTIMSGVTIGDGAAIAADSTVTRDVEPYAIVAGNPARFLRHRFDPETIARLRTLAWWEWDDERIEANLELLCSPDIPRFLHSQEGRGARRSLWKRLLGSRR